MVFADRNFCDIVDGACYLKYAPSSDEDKWAESDSWKTEPVDWAQYFSDSYALGIAGLRCGYKHFLFNQRGRVEIEIQQP